MKSEILVGKDLEALTQIMKDLGEPPFRAKQLLNWLYNKFETDFSKMSNLGNALIEKLKEKCQLSALQQRDVVPSKDKETFKFLWQTHDGHKVESVLILSGKRRTVCLSTSIGCPARCSFCASGKKGLIRHLDTEEIMAQLFLIDKFLHDKGERVSHVVFMGMGEPFENYDATASSIRQIHDKDLFNISQRRITVSTVGVVEGIRHLMADGFGVNLVFSLHAPNQKLREKLIPYAKKYPLPEILAALDDYSSKTGRDLTFEYTLLDGINDGDQEAAELASLLKKKQCTVNLIPYNPVPGLAFQRPSQERVFHFKRLCEKAGLVVTARYTKGDDVAAACGQLALQEDNGDG